MTLMERFYLWMLGEDKKYKPIGSLFGYESIEKLKADNTYVMGTYPYKILRAYEVESYNYE